MHTHTMKTTSGKPFRADRVIAVNGGGDSTGLRIVMDGGEVISDHWKTVAAANSFREHIYYAMSGSSLADCLPPWATDKVAEATSAECLNAGGTEEQAEAIYARIVAGIGEEPPGTDTKGEAA